MRHAVTTELQSILSQGYGKSNHWQLTSLSGNFEKVLICKYGSDPLKTYLPNSDIDITLVPLVSKQPDANSAMNYYTELD